MTAPETPTPSPDSTRPLFATPKQESRGSLMPIVIAGGAVLVILGALLFFFGRSKPAPTGPLPADAYAASLPMSGIAMSESSSLSGGKSTFIDGQIKNTGGKTVTGITVQVAFGNDMNMPPQLETLPMSFIRTREPYIDTIQIAAAPLAPGQQQDFRLIFEDITQNWNQQMPVVTIVQVKTK